MIGNAGVLLEKKNQFSFSLEKGTSRKRFCKALNSKRTDSALFLTIEQCKSSSSLRLQRQQFW